MSLDIGVGVDKGVGDDVGVGVGSDELSIYQATSHAGCSDEEMTDEKYEAYGNSPEVFRRLLTLTLSGELGHEIGTPLPVGWDEDAKALTDKWPSKGREWDYLEALILWAYGRPEDNFWRGRTANMKAFVTHVLKGNLTRQFDEALTRPETWCRLYYLTHNPNGCPFIEPLSSLIPISAAMKEKCNDFMEDKMTALNVSVLLSGQTEPDSFTVNINGQTKQGRTTAPASSSTSSMKVTSRGRLFFSE
ncbi:MAG: hypothetical protein ABSC48_02900 [Terracidiphilus sp.]